MVTSQSFGKFLSKHQSLALQQGHRITVVLSGETSWAYQVFREFEEVASAFGESNEQDDLIIYGEVNSANKVLASNMVLHNVNAQNYRYRLGTQSHYLVFQDPHFNLDALCALSGTIRAGGICFILMPTSVEQVPKINTKTQVQAKSFLNRFYQLVENNHQVFHYQQGDDLALTAFASQNQKATKQTREGNTFPLLCATQEQYYAVEAILKVVKGHRNRPLVLTADRGRGKSSGLAIACAQLLTENSSQPILISAPNISALDVFYAQLGASLADSHLPASEQEKLLKMVRFVPIDELVAHKHEAQVVMIDEAAAIPVYLLESLAQQYSRLVFSTTIHGYEGAGRGFGIRFMQSLARISPQFQKHHINTPIRWAQGDPLEAFMSQLGLLKAELPQLNETCLKEIKQGDFSHLHVEQINSTQLLANEDLLQEVFAILVTAHYQTSPNDLKMLLDHPALDLLVLSTEHNIVGVCLLIAEGKSTLEGETAEQDIADILSGKRRIKDQFLPQSLLKHCGERESFAYRYHRILRVAIHPEIHNQGLGRYFIKEVINYSKKEGVDVIGASFGLSPVLLPFWSKANFTLARIGFTKDKASGEHSALFVLGLSEQGQVFTTRLTSQFYQEFLHLLADEYQQLDTAMVTYLLSLMPLELVPELTDKDKLTVQDFAAQYRQYSPCAVSLYRYLLQLLAQTDIALDEAVYPWVAKLFQKRSLPDVCKQYGFTGKKAFNQAMVTFFKSHLSQRL